MAKLVIDNFLGGISPSDRIGAEGSYYQGKGVMPIHPLYFGYLCPGGAMSQIASTEYICGDTEIDSANRMVYIGAATKLLQYQIIESKLTAGTLFPRTLSSTLSNHAGHASGTIHDVKIYPVGSTNYLFYSWGDGTDGDVGRVELTGSLDFRDNFLSNYSSGGAVLTGASTTPRPMLEWGESGMLYIGNQRDVHQFDGQTGANGTFTSAKLSLPFGWWITSLFDAGDYIGIVAHYYPKSTWAWVQYKGRAAVFFWDGSSPIYNKRVYISDPEVRDVVSKNGEFYLFCRDSNGIGNIRKWNGVSFVKVKNIVCNVANGTGVDKYSRYAFSKAVRQWGDMIVFAGSGLGEIFAFGSPSVGMSENLWHVANISTTTTSNGEIISECVLNDRIIFNSYHEPTSTYRLNYIPLSGSNNSKFAYKSLYYEFPQRARINWVKAYFQPLGSGEGNDIKITTDYGKETIQLGNISYAEDGAVTTKKLSTGGNIICNNFRIEVDVDEGSGIKYGKFVVDYDLIENELI